MKSSRVYRHRPTLVLSWTLTVLVAGLIGAVVTWAARAPGIESIAKAFVVVVPLLAFAAFLLLSWRVRTTVDDEAVTQQWILRSFRIPYAEIAEVEPASGTGRWFLRLHCVDGKTFEVVPCQHGLRTLSARLGPPRVLRAALHDIEQRI